MKMVDSTAIRNIVLMGHAGSGKTTLTEAMLFQAGASDRFGRVEDGNTVCDYDPEEIRRRVSVSCAIAPLEWKGVKVNLLDTPGLFDFEGEALQGLFASDCALITVSGRSGVGVGAEKAYEAAARRKLPRAFYISKIGAERADYNKAFEDIRAHFGVSACAAVAPLPGEDGKGFVTLHDRTAHMYDAKGNEKTAPAPGDARLEELRTALCEAVAETDDALMEKYFAGEDFTPEEILGGLHKGMLNGSIAPVFCGAAVSLSGVSLLLDAVVSVFPAASECARTALDADGNEVSLRAEAAEPPAAFVFKTLADPYVGKLSFFRVLSGTLSADSTVLNARTGQAERLGKLYFVRGRRQTETQAVGPGDIGAVSKMASPLTGDTLCAPGHAVTLPAVPFPEPCLSMAVEPKAKGDEDKISQGLHRLMEEDPTLRFRVDTETKQQVISGLGEQHLDVIVSKLHAKFGVSVNLTVPRVPYRETIRKKVRVEGRHKKQTGGHGQFGDVWIEFEPGEKEELVFEERVFGGAVPRNFFPAVEKGLRECVAHGVLAGYPVVHLKATLVDGSYHPVDSSEMSFKIAASLAFRSGLAIASPVLLEPIGRLKATVPKANMGDIIGELNKRRGRVLGMSGEDENRQLIEAEVPMASMHDFSTVLRSVTQGRGSFTFAFERYEEAPPQVAQQVVESARVAAAAS